MARRSQEFQELLKHNKAKKQKNKSMEQVQYKFKPYYLSEFISDSTVDDPEEARMSKFLREFIEPYQSTATNFESLKRLLNIAILAWNLSLEENFDLDTIIPENNHRKSTHFNPHRRQEIKEMVLELIERKKEHFNEYKRLIIDYELLYTEKEFKLSTYSVPRD